MNKNTSNRIVYINTWGTFNEDHIQEWIEIQSTGSMGYDGFIKQKLKEIGLIPMKYMECEVFDEYRFMLAVIQYGINPYNLDEVACKIKA